MHDPTTVIREHPHASDAAADLTENSLKREEKTTDIFDPSFPEQMDGISTGVHLDVH